jgi:hypothetical protein
MSVELTHTYIYSTACIEPPLRAAVPTPKAPRKRGPTRVRTRARIGGAAAHNGPRRTEARPSASAIVRAAGPGAAHTEPKSMTRAVFHAPMLALKADAELNACAQKPHAVHADGQGSHGLGFRVQAEPAARARQRVRTQPIHHHRALVHAFIAPTDSHTYR